MKKSLFGAIFNGTGSLISLAIAAYAAWTIFDMLWYVKDSIRSPICGVIANPCSQEIAMALPFAVAAMVISTTCACGLALAAQRHFYEWRAAQENAQRYALAVLRAFTR